MSYCAQAAEQGDGEWVAIHCGANKEHVKNKALMASVRKQWPGCPSDEELLGQQKHLLGTARFVDGGEWSCVAARRARTPSAAF